MGLKPKTLPMIDADRFAIEPGSVDLFANDRVGMLQDRDALGRHLTDDSHTKTRTWERLSPHDLVGQAEFLTESADLIFEQGAQRFDQFQGHVVG